MQHTRACPCATQITIAVKEAENSLSAGESGDRNSSISTSPVPCPTPSCLTFGDRSSGLGIDLLGLPLRLGVGATFALRLAFVWDSEMRFEFVWDSSLRLDFA